METRELKKQEYAQALALAWEVFCEYEAPEYSKEGVASFKSTIDDAGYVSMLRIYGCFEGESLVGTLATRGEGDHIALFFVKGSYHRRGIGKGLFALARADNRSGRMTVNSSPYAVEVYHHLGFSDTACEQLSDGIRYTPMEFFFKV